MPEDNRMAMRENIQSVLGSMMPDANGNIKATTNNVPLQMSGNMDTTSPNGSLPQGEVDMDQIMSLMKGKRGLIMGVANERFLFTSLSLVSIFLLYFLVIKSCIQQQNQLRII